MVASCPRSQSFGMPRHRRLPTLVVLLVSLSPTCAPDEPGGRDRRVAWWRGGLAAPACIDSLWPIDAARAEWRALPEPLTDVDYKIYWNEVFQVFEIVFRNRSASGVSFQYSVGSPDAPTALALDRELRATEEQLPPGQTIAHALPNRRACVRARRR